MAAYKNEGYITTILPCCVELMQYMYQRGYVVITGCNSQYAMVKSLSL